MVKTCLAGRYVEFPDLVKALICLFLRFYQRIISPMIHFIGGPGFGCRYQPTCSQYFMEAVIHHGALKGSWLGFKRLSKCHPWGGQGYDPVPGTESASCCNSRTSKNPSTP
ncbi:MAG: membrane protein insertion efficiency factor YidD [Verrucomicrobiaceae bacterium]|nr:membrane protein insertion efficiency factor YidD [Verrucomicrobiaceae bacterium]